MSKRLLTLVAISMTNPLTGLIDSTHILFDLQQANEIAQQFSGCLEPDQIASRATNGLVEKFHCAFARIWLLEPDQTTLKLVASSGMYTNTDGFFGRVPLGAYKVGKIAQNRISFLSNNLAAEPWVGNREWAIANSIHGFAGYPLMIQDRVVGVLATFSHSPMEPEFLEVLQLLCTIVAIALDTAFQHQKAKQTWQSSTHHPAFSHLPLSDQLVRILSSTRLTLVGTEQPLTLAIAFVFLKAAEILNKVKCTYCRLIYIESSVALEAVVPKSSELDQPPEGYIETAFSELYLTVSNLGGVLQTQTSMNQPAVQVRLKIPYPLEQSGERLRIQCRFPVLQLAFTHLAGLAGLTVCHEVDQALPLLTDDETQLRSSKRILWIQQGTQPAPKGVQASIDLSISANQLRQAVAAVAYDQLWSMKPDTAMQQVLSERELEILALLTQGHRDRDIADLLIISESTVKFHVSNVLNKLKARTRYQAIHQAMVQGWI